MAWLIGAAIIFFITCWPYLLGTYLAVRGGAKNPSTERFVVGWLFETLYVAAVVGWIVINRARRAHQSAEQAAHLADVVASGSVYQTNHAKSVVYRHGTCTVNHRSVGTAKSCDKSTTFAVNQAPSHAGARQPFVPDYRSAARWPLVILGVGISIGLIMLVAHPIHSVVEDAAAKPCPTTTSEAGLPLLIVPDLVGQNAESAETKLKAQGVQNVVFSSANSRYKSVIVPSNWTVEASHPRQGCSIARGSTIELLVTK